MAQFDLFRTPKRSWNTGRIIGAKPPLKPKHVWGIRQQLKATGKVRDLALFNCAVDAKLRGCDLVKLRVSDVAPGGALRQRATVIQQKTGRPEGEGRQLLRAREGGRRRSRRAVCRACGGVPGAGGGVAGGEVSHSIRGRHKATA
jgi:hypothetical protein